MKELVVPKEYGYVQSYIKSEIKSFSVEPITENTLKGLVPGQTRVFFLNRLHEILATYGPAFWIGSSDPLWKIMVDLCGKEGEEFGCIVCYCRGFVTVYETSVEGTVFYNRQIGLKSVVI